MTQLNSDRPLLVRRTATLVAGALALGLSSCTTQQKYDEAISQAKYYQNQAFDWERYAHELETENEELKEKLAAGAVSGLIDSSFDKDFESRLSGLQGMIDQLGRPPGDIERFDVEGGYVYMVQDKILFQSGSADISDAGKKAILQLAQRIQAEPHGRIWVRGHTDSDKVVRPATLQKFPHGNIELSAARAIEVAAVLVGEGRVPQDDVAVVGFGPHEPLKPNDSADNKRLNRRVEIFVSDEETGR